TLSCRAARRPNFAPARLVVSRIQLGSPRMPHPLSTELLERMDAYWRAAHYLSGGQIYLQDNPLLEVPWERAHIKPRLLGHWGTTAGLNFLLRAPQPADQGKRPRHDLRHRARPRRAWARGAHLSRRHLHRNLSGDRAQPERAAAPVPAVLVALRDTEPRRSGDAGLDP